MPTVSAMSRRWWIRQAWTGLLASAGAFLVQVAFGHSWKTALYWAFGVLTLGVLAVLNILHAKRYRPEKFAQYKAIQEACLER